MDLHERTLSLFKFLDNRLSLKYYKPDNGGGRGFVLLVARKYDVKLPAHKGGASRKGNLIYIVPLDPAYPALAGRGTCRSTDHYLNNSL